MGWFNHQPGKNILSINYLKGPVRPGPVVVDSSRRPSLGELSQGDFAYGDEGGGGYQTPGPVETQTEIRPHRRCKRACLSGGTNTVSFSWGGGGGPFFCR